ncbi:hypothetical protein [Chitinophaga solisilvae]|uniref:hypothetical protein n=1 Tax=Chitinophaga solisilvae TaxID=1233460 RepID=UPI00136B26F9|nr:hypothetical protein [Chitinophaga solisilvae]
MSVVKVTLTQLIGAFKKHYAFSSKDDQISHLLILFYAVECGLKAKYLKKYNRLNTDDFETLPVNKKYGHGHDIYAWVKDLKIPALGYIDSRTNKPLVQMHERLRYGTYSAGTENLQVKFLRDLSLYLKKEL